MENIKANRKAFDAYNILYYPMFGENGLYPNIDVKETVTPSTEDYAKALTVQDNLSSTPYALSERAIAALSQVYALMRVNGIDGVIDPRKDIADIVPDAPLSTPMYPDFPTQVLEISEEQFRLDQITHYMSTYGVEMMAFALFGAQVNVEHGWMPDVEATEKTRDDESLVEKHIVDIVLSPAAMAAVVSADLGRPKRMSEPACALASELFGSGAIGAVGVAFHENMMEIIRAAADTSSAELVSVCASLTQHPGDIFKAILWCCEKNGKNHIQTKTKKGFCRALEAYDVDDIAHNLADLSRKGEHAANKLSTARFAGKKLADACSLVANGTVRSYNSVLESKWADFSDGKDTGGSALLAWYGKRPGIMLRSLARLLRSGVPAAAVEAACMDHVDDFALATLIQIETACSADKLRVERDWRGAPLNCEDVERREANAETNCALAVLTAKLISKRLSSIETPLANKKVFVDDCGFSLVGSLVLPNETSNTSGAYPPCGMAYDVPSDKVLRFFTFWNNESRRVDIDLHFHYLDSEGNKGHIGWSADFRSNGMVFSGDVTHSDNAAEYLDVDMAAAKDSDVDVIYQRQHIFRGASNWEDIDTCFSGALVVGDTAPDVKLYNSNNILFHDDLNGDGQEVEYAMIDVPNHFVRILRGVNLPYVRSAFTLGAYLGLLFEAQGCELVRDVGEADIVLAIGRASGDAVDGKPVVSLIDNGFFIQ